MKKIKVLHFELDDNIGGIEMFIYNLYSHIDREKFQFDIVTRRDNPAKKHELEELGANIIKVSSYKKIFKYIKDVNEILENGYDVVHIHKNSASIILPFILSSKHNVKNIISHSHNTAPNGGVILKFLHYLNRNKMYKLSNVHLACGKEAGCWMYGKKDFIQINNAIDLERFKFNEVLRKEIRDKYNLNGKHVIGHIGRFVYQKNHSFLIDVFEKVAEKDKNAILLLVGEGKLLEDTKEKVRKLGLKDKVLFVGSQKDIYKFYQGMDAFVLPSRYEGLVIVMIEAQASGLSCVISKEVPIETKILDNVVCMDLNENVDVWAEAVINSVKNGRYVNATKEVEKAGYSLEKEIEKVVKIYEQYQI